MTSDQLTAAGLQQEQQQQQQKLDMGARSKPRLGPSMCD
eukprot:CAMPEP_0206582848 /NCGR_PEP_ID=MMETSP0325_2-20121206/34743_1 /ASSEMBLY_ACC=CAM_ASM_000347 /TAXON_ID=2866 /ORGANISM="Crypthecodinium cohnii, Strain Seligo" /LENGTH=38 /DNA_ID= /DNA_START= /DNA_END= /DNA_ORIENTATION=